MYKQKLNTQLLLDARSLKMFYWTLIYFILYTYVIYLFIICIVCYLFIKGKLLCNRVNFYITKNLSKLYDYNKTSDRDSKKREKEAAEIIIFY